MFSIVWSFDFAFCTPRIYYFGQNMKYWYSLRVFWVLTCGDFLPFSPIPQFIFLVVLGYFWLYMWMYVCGYVCIHWRPNWKTVLFIHLLPAVEIKQIFAFVPQFFPPNHRINEKYLEFKIWRDVGALFLTCLVNCHLLFFGFKMSGDFFATSFMLG